MIILKFTVKFRSDDVDIDVSWESEPQFDPLADHRFYTKDPRFGTAFLFLFISLLRIYSILQSRSTSILSILYSTALNNQFFVSYFSGVLMIC